MKAVLALSAALLAAPLAASTGTQSLPGVSDQETEISHGVIQQFERGHGDVLFVRDQSDRWYRVQVNHGCLSGPIELRQVVFDNGTSSRIDRFTKIFVPKDLRTCTIDSIRRSAAPPQVDSHSLVTLD
jgi:hypothetical protein